MNATISTLGALTARVQAGGASLEEASSRTGELAVRVTAFALLAAFGALHWSALVTDPPVTATLIAVAIAAVAGPAISLVPTPEHEAWRVGLARAAIVTVALGGALAVMGLPGRMIAPAGWGELMDAVGRGLTGLRTAEWPYGGPDEWVRLTLLLAIPPVVTLSSALAFWPRLGGRRGPRPAAVVLLLGLYGVAVAQLDPGEPLARGAVLLALVAAWVLLPRVRPREALRAAAVLALVAVLAAPLALRLPGTEPVVDYRSWRWTGAASTFEWDHSYGPIEWPRRGDVAMTIESDRPHYWRAMTLDSFDGFRWVRSLAGASTLTAPEEPPTHRPAWDVSAKVTVGALVSEAVVSPGSVESVDGVEPAVVSRDGTVQATAELEQGHTYTVHAYAPNPTVGKMRRASEAVPASVTPSTLIQLPRPGAPNPEAPGETGESDPAGPAFSLPPRREGAGTSDAESAVLGSPYARTYRLARQVAAPARTNYDAVRRIEEFLRAGYSYSERPPEHQYPLDGFLFESRSGYCQQFAGAMALMLRMNGIPSRVVAGFAPGVRTAGTREFTVRDVDAHSWVEVYFAGIGWVPFDPTPPEAPADSQSDGSVASAARGSSGRRVGLGDLFTSEPGATGIAAAALERAGVAGAKAGNPSIVRQASVPVTAREVEDRVPVAWLAGAVALLLLGSLALLRAGGGAGRTQDADVRELGVALRRLGLRPKPGGTLLELERRLDRSGQLAAAGYVRLLRAQRFGPPGDRATDPRGRRALRRSLTAGGGWRGLVRGYLALPPRRG